MLVRVAFGVGLLALGYFVGREVGRNESLRRSLDEGEPSEGLDAGGTPESVLREQAQRSDADRQPET
jgi:hypothetical protein